MIVFITAFFFFNKCVVGNEQLIDRAKPDDLHLPFQQFLFINILMAAF